MLYWAHRQPDPDNLMGHRTSKDLYRALGLRLDQAPVRTPWTPVFHDLVRALYTPAEAELIIRLPHRPSTLDGADLHLHLEDGQLRCVQPQPVRHGH